ncbi:hypothetical protein SEA_ASHTON_26 [Microbacterium phage Ashton]|uniref:Uncharacterized protein n=1 Tax=Microbacterium phage Ashton TaxID=2562366 RepID=A0A6M3T0H5_9CAUD|nr:hypothetical protein SEA_ASHTON_26 [Microbacterium phage Ashton]
MTQHKSITIECDICHKEIEPEQMHVFAGVYGYDFHMDCLRQTDGTLIGFLVDDVHVGVSKDFIDRPAHANRLYWERRKVIAVSSPDGEYADTPSNRWPEKGR